MRINPFFELYVGDRLSSSEFVNIFSPFLVRYAEALFLPGNVVVKGVQGSGKSMLLSLLKPEVRLEYVRAGAEFPVPSAVSNFIGAGINLAHSNAIDFGYRAISEDPMEAALFFADFVNYTIILDLFESIKKLGSQPHESLRSLQIDLSAERLEQFAKTLGSADIFQGFLSSTQSFEAIIIKMRSRLNSYRRFLHLNDQELHDSIRGSKTDIGAPISEVISMLREWEIIGADVDVLIHVDQYEELANISGRAGAAIDYRKVINRALARRDPRVSYRIGTRGHAWRNHGFIFGADAKLEEERDYKFIDLDQMLRRNENRKTWVFPGFVEDVFARRLKHAGFAPPEASGKQLLQRVFGDGLDPGLKALKYGGRHPERSVKIESSWPQDARDGLIALARTDPLSARLLEAWILQQVDRKPKGAPSAREVSMDMRVEMDAKIWWKKERIELALIQIAGRCQQRPLWSGAEDVVELSGGSILTFLSICQFIWDTQNQSKDSRLSAGNLSEIELEVQAIGIFKASDYWLKKISQETGRSGDRFRVTKQIGIYLSRLLYADRQMSYPGHNGFSLADDELERFPHVKSLIEEMSDYGTIVVAPHTTKEKDRRARQKIYLNPILCPQFKIHYKRTKEPAYVSPIQIENLMREAGLEVPASAVRRAGQQEQPKLPLFDDSGEL